MSQKIRHRFDPKWYDVFGEPFYIVRKRLRQGIVRYAGEISGSLLDFGCGSKPYSDCFTVVEYIGLDIETEVSSRNPELRADVFYDGKRIPFSDGRFDAVFSTEVLEHVFNPDEILAELHRVLKPNGQMLLTCPFFWPEHEQPYDYARYTSFGLTTLLQKHGFEIIAFEKTGSYFDALAQGLITYLYFFIPHRPRALEAIVFSIFITPFLLIALLLSAILPKRIRRSDLYLNNVVFARKK